MIIFYVIFVHNISASNGVSRKIEAQYKYSRGLKHKMVFIIMISNVDALEEWVYNDDIYLIDNKDQQDFAKSFTLLKEKLSALKFEKNKDIIYFRGMKVSYALLDFLKDHPAVFEHNSKALEEQLTIIKEMSLLKSIGALLYYGPSLLKKRYLIPKVLKAASGGIAVTNELANYEKDLCASDYECFVVGNGTDYTKIKMVDKIDSIETIKLVMLAGSLNHWNGIERIINSVKAHPSLGGYKIFILGPIKQSQKEMAENIDQVTFVKSKYGNELSEFLGEMHGGIGTLALFRKKMEEACSLKSREYFAAGLPFVNGCKDPDVIANDELKPYVFQVPNNDTILPLPEIVNFVRNHYENGFTKKELREKSERYLHMKVKVERLHDCLVELATKKTNR